jgi:hypothetical protein
VVIEEEEVRLLVMAVVGDPPVLRGVLAARGAPRAAGARLEDEDGINGSRDLYY